MRRPDVHLLMVGLALTVVACSPGAGIQGSPPLSTKVGQTLTIAPAQMLADTGGATPVAFDTPSHGTISHGAEGAVVYTPQPGFTGTDELRVTVTDAVKLYSESLPPLTTIGTVSVQANGHGSAIAAVPDKTDEIYALSDRGPIADGPIDGEKVLLVADFHPQIARLKLDAGIASLQQMITLEGRDGKPMVGQLNNQGGTGEKLVDLQGRPLPASDHGLDPEGMVAMTDGTFWVSDEYGPFVVHFDAAGKELERLSPFDGTLPAELALRTANQGLEGLTITPDGTTLVAMMQSALNTPGLRGSAKSVPFTRIVTVNLADRSDVHEYLFPLDNPQQSKMVVSEITAVSATTFLVDERDDKFAPDGQKKIYLADISHATDVGPHATVAGAAYRADAGGLMIDGKPIETFIGVTDDHSATETLRAAGINLATKTLALDLSGLLRSLSPSGDFFGHDRIEGLLTPDGGKTLIVSCDSDFGVTKLNAKDGVLSLTPKLLPNGTQDSVQYLAVDTLKLPAKTETVTLPIRVG